MIDKIEHIRFITDLKWDWDHGLEHYKRVAQYVKKILLQLNTSERTIDLGILAAFLHDIGLSKGSKVDHALESSKIFTEYIQNMDIALEEIEMLRHAIRDHSEGNHIQSPIGLSLVLGDKLDITYHRTQNSSIQDKMNQEIQKIKSVKVEITADNLIVTYQVDNDFNADMLNGWNKSITIPKKVADYLNKRYTFIINDALIDYNRILNLKKY